MGNFFRRKITLFPRHFCFTFYHFHYKIPLAVSNSNSKVTLLKGFVLNLRPDETPRLQNAQKATIYPPVYEAPLLCISFGYTRAHTCPKTSPLYVTCESIVVVVGSIEGMEQRHFLVLEYDREKFITAAA